MAVLHLLVSAAVIASHIPAIALYTLLMVICWSLWQTLRLHALRIAPRSAVGFALRDNGDWELFHEEGQSSVAQLESDHTVVLFWMMLLRFRAGQRRLTLLLLPDMIDRESWRHLAVRLRSLNGNG